MKTSVALLLALICIQAAAATLPAQKALPKDTVMVLAIPDAPKSRAAFNASAYGQLWNDPAMRPFREDFLARFQSDLLGPFEKEAGVSLAECATLIQGQLTVAFIRSEAANEIAPILIADAQDQAPKLKSILADARKKWVASGRQVKTQTIRGIDFDTFIIRRGEFNNSIKKSLPVTANSASQTHEDDSTIELLVGQVDSVLLASSSTNATEKVVIRLTGGLLPSLEQEPLFQADYNAWFHDAPAYLWLNVQAFYNAFLRRGESIEVAPAGGMDLRVLFFATGVSELKTIACAWREAGDGFMVQGFLGIPEARRRGIFKALPSGDKDASPPPFVPADTVKFVRARVDMAEAWASIEKLIRDINPGARETIDYLLENAGKTRDEKYNLRAEISGNLGTDIITYEKKNNADSNPNSVILIGSPNPEKLAAALKVAVEFFGQGVTVKETDFLGRKLRTYSSDSRDRLSFAAGGSYVAFSKNVSLVQEYIRGCDDKAKSLLSNTPGLADAAEKAGGMNRGFFGYDNQRDEFRALFESLRKKGAPTPLALRHAANLNQWANFSLLPPYETVQKYFGFTVYGGRSSADGFVATFFAPAPTPQTKPGAQ